MTIKTFTPDGAATTTIAGAAASASATLSQFSNCVRVYNAGPNKAFIRFGTGVTTALATDMPIAPNSTEVFTKGATTTVAGICSGVETATLYFTCGEGL
jgi:hypothetical protein